MLDLELYALIMPDWEGIRPVEVGGITDGAITEFRMKIGIVPQRWVAKHHGYMEGEQFCDDMVKGPFGRWNHVHKFVENNDSEMQIQDRIDWKLPFHFFTRIGAPIMVMPRVNQMFKHRFSSYSCRFETARNVQRCTTKANSHHRFHRSYRDSAWGFPRNRRP